MRDLHNNIDVRPAIDPYDHATGDAAVSTEVCDLQGFKSCELLLHFGSIADADVTLAIVFYDGDTTSPASAVDDAELLGTEALAMPLFSDDNKAYKIGYVGDARYVKATITPTNNTGAILMEAMWLLGFPDNAATANPPANPAAI